MEENEIVNSPEFWRMMGLLIADKDNPVTFGNTDLRLIRLFAGLGEKLCPSSVTIRKKIDKRVNRKPFWRVRIVKPLKQIVLDISKSLENYLEIIPEKCFWQFVTGMYEGDGTLTLRPGRVCKAKVKFYPEVEIKFSGDERKIAEKIAERMKKYNIKVNLKTYRNYVRFRLSSICSVLLFFQKVQPIIKNPFYPKSFENTRTRDSKRIIETFKTVQSLVKKFGINPENGWVDLRKFRRSDKS